LFEELAEADACIQAATLSGAIPTGAFEPGDPVAALLAWLGGLVQALTV